VSSTPEDAQPLLGEPPSHDGELSFGTIVRRASGLSLASVLGAAATAPVMVVIGRWLGPVDLGRAQFVTLVYFYASLLRSGAFEGGIRQFVDSRARGETETADRAEQAGYTTELAVSVVPGLALLAAALFVGDPLRVLGLALAPVAVVASSFAGFLGGRFIAREQFGVVARVTAIRSVLVAGGLLAGVAGFGPAAVFVVPIVVNVLVSALYASHRPRLALGLRFDWDTARPLLKVGFPLGMATVVYWAYRMTGPLSLAIGDDVRALGLYTFAAAPVGVAVQVVASLSAVLTPGLWGRMAADTTGRWVDEGRRLTVASAILVAAVTNLVQAALPPVIKLVAPAFEPSVPLVYVLAFDVLLLSVAAFPALVLDSVRVNRQTRHLAIWIGATVLNLAANAIALATDHGPLAIAWIDVWVQVIVVVVIFETALTHIGGREARWRYYVPLLGVGALTAALALGLFRDDRPVASVVELAGQLGVRVGTVAVVWAVVAVAYRRRVPRGA
jgi:O-antigen/teichoic acid export membrane protein